ncbi:MAG: Maf family protein [Candidatus Acidiferrales bacterium]|jgi:septum formation protein
MKLILASASPRRAQILRGAGLSFEAVPSDVDEDPLDGESPEHCVRRLAQQKARLAAVRAAGPAIIVGADTVVVADGKILGKPCSAEDARDMLRLLSGKTHTVYTGLVLIRLPDGASRTDIEATQVTFDLMSAEEISAYVASGEPFDKAGAYGIQGRGGRYISRIEGCYFNVVGLPLARLYRHLIDLGWKPGPEPVHDSD